MGQQDFQKYYNLEAYLFEEVGPEFRRHLKLSAFDFFCIVIWKANRSKSKIARRLLAQDHRDLSTAVDELVRQLNEAIESKDKLEVLIVQWGLRLPMASAILSVLYPIDFTVYDIRVCKQLGEFEDAQYKTNFESMWQRYSAYIDRVKASNSQLPSLREKDRQLWGKSFHDQLHHDIGGQFDRGEVEPDFEE